MDKVIKWNLADGSSSGQRLQYRLFGATDWINYDTVGATVTSEVIYNLLDNSKYEVRIVNLCAGGEYPSDTKVLNTLVCPTPDITAGSNSISVSIAAVGNVTKYIFLFYTGDQLSQTILFQGPFTTGQTVTKDFDSLIAGTAYGLRVVPYIGDDSFKDDCPIISINTVPPSTTAPTTVPPTTVPPTTVPATTSPEGNPPSDSSASLIPG